MSNLIKRQDAIDAVEKHACNTQRILDPYNKMCLELLSSLISLALTGWQPLD